MIPENWNEIIAGLPGASLLQTSQWAEVKARMGWEAFPKLWKKSDGTVEAAALILKRPLIPGPGGKFMSFLYVPRGPLMDWNDNELRERVLKDLAAFARSQHALFVRLIRTSRHPSGNPVPKSSVKIPPDKSCSHSIRQMAG